MNESRNVKIGIALLFAAAVLMILWVAARSAVSLYVDAVWFAAVGYSDVFWVMFRARFLAGGIAFIAGVVVLAANIICAYRRAPFRGESIIEGLEMDPARVDAAVRVLFALGAVFGAALVAFPVARNWLVFINFLHAVPFGVEEPVFGRDVAFYVFRLPAVAYVCKTALVLTVLSMAFAFGVYYVRGVVSFQEEGRVLPPPVFRHLTLLAAPAAMLFSVRFWVGQYQVLLSKRGAVFGAGYTDIHAQIGACKILFAAGIVLGLWFLVNAFRARRPGNLYALGAFIALWFGAGVAYPFVIQHFVVRPNEWACEQDYLRRNIEFTRMAYGLDAVHVTPWPGDGELGPALLDAHPGTTGNLQLWDVDPLRDVYNQKQRIRSYYTFEDVDVDRYEIDGRSQPVMVAPRELALSDLPEKSRVWTNLHLCYTHGYGLCMSLANRAAPGGLPDFLIRDIPPVPRRGLRVAQPRIYYGEKTQSYALVDTRTEEFDYPGDPDNFFNRYDGAGGIPIGGLARRALLSWYVGNKEVLFTEQFTDASRILLFRQVRARAARLAPFVVFDEDPYPVLHDGRIVWILDGYTITRRFPYSEAFGIANYWRNSVKATVDAYDGTVHLYRTAQADPILAVFDTVFPDLFKPLDEMPAELRRHLRYPQDMFRVQTLIYHKYHVDDAQVFFNGEDVWTFPRLTEGEAVSYESPRFLVMELPGAGAGEEFVVTRSFTVEGKDNMIGWMAGRCDEPHYGELHLYRLPKQRNIYGPNQAKGRFNQDPEVSEFTTLMGQRGSAVIQSKVLAVPIGEGLLYVQSLFIEDPEVKIPELKQVVVGAGDRVAMAPTLDRALAELFGDEPVRALIDAAASERPEEAGAGPDEQQARDLYERARERLKAGDWAGFGEAFDALGRALKGQP
ncbi:MAG: UPF0182 family protein [Candidatus Hydrogenedentes bacterium]|nr:UPF0182 family protein [Candidatus Hydrogenedentota bacterium]